MENRGRTPLDEIQQRVVRRIETLGNRKGIFHIDSDPMPEGETFHQKCAERQVPFWEIVKKQAAAGLQDANQLNQPFAGPSKILSVGQVVVHLGRVILV